MALLHAKPHRFTVPEFERLYESGFFGRNAKLELIEGEIVPMPPMNTPHGNAIMLSNNVLTQRFGDTHWVRVQCPINLTLRSQPEPDFALVPKSTDLSSHPQAADLIVEVSDSSLAYDRDDKASLYAMGGIPEVWIVNVVDRCLEVMRDPGPQSGRTFGFHYRTMTTHGPGESTSPLFCPGRSVQVIDLLGPALATRPD